MAGRSGPASVCSACSGRAGWERRDVGDRGRPRPLRSGWRCASHMVSPAERLPVMIWVWPWMASPFTKVPLREPRPRRPRPTRSGDLAWCATTVGGSTIGVPPRPTSQARRARPPPAPAPSSLQASLGTQPSLRGGHAARHPVGSLPGGTSRRSPVALGSNSAVALPGRASGPATSPRPFRVRRPPGGRRTRPFPIRGAPTRTRRPEWSLHPCGPGRVQRRRGCGSHRRPVKPPGIRSSGGRVAATAWLAGPRRRPPPTASCGPSSRRRQHDRATANSHRGPWRPHPLVDQPRERPARSSTLPLRGPRRRRVELRPVAEGPGCSSWRAAEADANPGGRKRTRPQVGGS